MKINRPTAFIIFYFTMIALPCLFAAWILFAQEPSLVMLIAKLAAAGLYTALIFMIGYWGFIGYFLRYIIAALYLLPAAYSLLSFGSGAQAPANIFLLTVCIIIAVLLIYFITRSLKAFSYKGDAVKLSFPFRSGSYYVLEGGDSKAGSLVNYHYAGSSHSKNNVNKSMRYATDIVKLNSGGMFSRGALPSSVDNYNIYHEPIYSPCDGVVIKVSDGMDNEIPFFGKHPYNVGNHVVIQTNGVNVLMGHIQKSSIKVKEGDSVTKGQHLADVGNSGLTEFPHLHIQAMNATDSIWSGEGVPMLFDGRFLLKNDIVKS